MASGEQRARRLGLLGMLDSVDPRIRPAEMGRPMALEKKNQTQAQSNQPQPHTPSKQHPLVDALILFDRTSTHLHASTHVTLL